MPTIPPSRVPLGMVAESDLKVQNYPGFSDTLPRVLTPPKPYSAISMVRALNQIRELLIDIDPKDDSHDDRINASIDDLDIMLKCVK